MKLEQKLYKFSDQIRDLRISKNGVFLEHDIKYVFQKHKIIGDYIEGYSLLQYFKIESGCLYDGDVSEYKFFSDGKQINIVKICDPFIISADIKIIYQYIKDVSDILGIKQPEKTFHKMDEKDSNQFILDRKIVEQQKQEIKGEKEKEIKEDDNNFYDEKRYRLFSRRLSKLGFNFYKNDYFVFFFSYDIPDGESPCLFKITEQNYQLLNGSLISEIPIEYEFTDNDGKDKILTLIEGKIEIETL